MTGTRSKRIMTLFIILFFMPAGPALSQCVNKTVLERSQAIHGINNGIDHYYQNLIIQDIAIAGQQKFQDISLYFNYQVSYSADHCRPGQIEVSVLPVKVRHQPLFYLGYDISASLIPEKASLVFHVRQENGLVTDSLTFPGIRIGIDSGLYTSQFYPNPVNSALKIDFARADFRYSRSSYENFRDHMLKIDDYYAASFIADSAVHWTSLGFLSENDNLAVMMLRQVELERLLSYINPERFDSVFIYGQHDLRDLDSRFRSLAGLNQRYKAIIGYHHTISGPTGIAFVKNEILESYLDHLDHYYELSFRTDFHFVHFLNELASPEFTNASLLGLYKKLRDLKRLPSSAPALYSQILVNELIERGKEYEIAGNQLRAMTYYRTARHLSELLHLNDSRDIASLYAGRMVEAISSSYAEISKKAAERENPAMAAQYFQDARELFNEEGNITGIPSWLIDYERWLYSDFETQVVKCIDQKNYIKALDYLNEININCQAYDTYQCPGLFHEWMRQTREGIYVQLLDRAWSLMKADELYESEQVYRQAVEMRQKEGYRIVKNVSEAKLEVIFRQMHYEENYDEGLRYFNNDEFVSALYYFNKADFLEKSGIDEPNPQLIGNRQDAARQVILNLMSEGRLKAWAHDFDGAGKVLQQAGGMLDEYRFAPGDSLANLYKDLENNILQAECEKISSDYNNLMSKSESAEKDGDYILASRFAIDAVTVSMDNLKCRINDEQAWYRKIRLETLARYQQMENNLALLAKVPVADYMEAFQELKSYYYRNKLLEQGVVMTPLYDRVIAQWDPGFLTGMLDHYIYLKNFSQAIRVLQRMNELQFDPNPLKDRQKSLARYMAGDDYLNHGKDDPWGILDSYTGGDKWYRYFNRSYKKAWLKSAKWNIKSWPIIWKK